MLECEVHSLSLALRFEVNKIYMQMVKQGYIMTLA